MFSMCSQHVQRLSTGPNIEHKKYNYFQNGWFKITISFIGRITCAYNDLLLSQANDEKIKLSVYVEPLSYWPRWNWPCGAAPVQGPTSTASQATLTLYSLCCEYWGSQIQFLSLLLGWYLCEWQFSEGGGKEWNCRLIF